MLSLGGCTENKKYVRFMGRDEPKIKNLCSFSVVTEFVKGALNTGEAFYQRAQDLIVTTWRDITGLD